MRTLRLRSVTQSTSLKLLYFVDEIESNAKERLCLQKDFWRVQEQRIWQMLSRQDTFIGQAGDALPALGQLF